MAAWSRIGRGGAQLSQSLSRAALASEGGATPGASSALRNASGAPSRGGLGQRVSPLHGLALAGLADRSAGGGVLSRGISTTAPRLQPRSAAAAVAEPLDGEGRRASTCLASGRRSPTRSPGWWCSEPGGRRAGSSRTWTRAPTTSSASRRGTTWCSRRCWRPRASARSSSAPSSSPSTASRPRSPPNLAPTSTSPTAPASTRRSTRYVHAPRRL
jgi:hypothetical protein